MQVLDLLEVGFYSLHYKHKRGRDGGRSGGRLGDFQLTEKLQLLALNGRDAAGSLAVEPNTVLMDETGGVHTWWSWYCRAAHSRARIEAITSRPLLLAAVGKVVNHANQTTLFLTPLHGKAEVLKALISNIGAAGDVPLAVEP